MMNKKGFTLIELLVVIAIIALLLSIVMPSLKMAKEQAKRLICSNNLKSMAAFVHTYAADYDDFIPGCNYSTGATGGAGNSASTYVAFMIDRDLASAEARVQDAVQKGYVYGPAMLYTAGYVEMPEMFYCPSAPKVVDDVSADRSISFHYDAYHGDGHDWPWNIETAYHDAVVRTSYHYIPQHGREKAAVASGRRFPVIAKKAADLGVNHVMFTDILASFGQVSHAKSGKPGVNVAKSDGSVSFDNNPDAFDPALWGSVFLTKNEPIFREVISLLK